ncbi:MAG: protein-disulfide reductase DsbD [Gammaproteobacteria bacterium]|nr:protein-disulfide reductase DsbD [Gammaproteobacteria bacterium]
MTRISHRWFAYVLAMLWLALPNLGSALWQEDELLEPNAAFAFSAATEASGNLRVQWKVAEGYYLYRSRIQLRSDTPGVELGEPQFPAGKIKDDEFFGKVEIYRGPVDITVPVTRSADAPATFKLIAVSQGCADQGVCYPPHTQTAELSLASATPVAAATATSSPLDKLAKLSQELGFDNNDNEFLDPDIAFRPVITASADGAELLVRWDIEDGYYLYRDKFRIALESSEGVTLQDAQFPAGEFKDDETFGRVEVYHHLVEARVPLSRSQTDATSLRIKLSYQGCAEAGICYPPQNKILDVDVPAGTGAIATTAGITPPATSAPAQTQTLSDNAPVTEQDRIARILTDKPLWLSMLLFFGLGIGLSVTPCVFPMIPILSSIIVGQGEGLTTRRAFMLSLVYVLAMALTYTVAGVIAALFGENLQAAFQNPWILSSFAAVFVLLALSMFGFYDLQMPAALQSRLSALSNRQQGGTLVGVAVMGFLSALIVGPCVAAPLAAALLVIGQTGDTVLGGSALFALSMGMGTPLLAIGTGAGKLLPRAGGWMNAVKAVFGVLLLAVAIWMLERILPAAVSMTLWAALLITSAVYMGALEKLDVDATGWHKLWKGVGLILLVQGVLVLAGVAAGSNDVLQPLRGAALTGNASTTQAATSLDFQRIKSVDDLNQAITQANRQGKTVMLDFYADWCTECHRMEKNTFRNADVLNALGNAVALQADVTANDDTDKALLQHFKLIGPPAILFFDNNGQELGRHRVVGYMDPETFSAHVQRAYGEK